MTNEASTTTEAAAIAEPGAHVAPEKAPSTKAAKPKKGATKGQKTAKAAKPAAKKAASKPAAKKETKPAGKKAAKADAPVPREFSKKAIVIDLMRRKDGATMAEIAKATDWQQHYADVRIMPTCAGNPACGAGIAAMESA